MKILLFLAVFSTAVKAQTVRLDSLIAVAFYHPEVYQTVFFDYEGGELPFHLPKGKYCFIDPDTTFAKVRPETGDQLLYSWPNERKVVTVTIVHDDRGDVFVKGDIVMDRFIKHYVVFDKILILGNRAELQFHTSGNHQGKGFKPKRVECSLIRDRDKWQVSSINILH